MHENGIRIHEHSVKSTCTTESDVKFPTTRMSSVVSCSSFFTVFVVCIFGVVFFLI